MPDTKFADLTLDKALQLAGGDPDMDLQRALKARLSSLQNEQSIFRVMADRFDELYFTTTFTDWGADLWADDPSATTEGRSHVSVNSPEVYVKIPAALQAVEPAENMLAQEDSPESRAAAQAMERIRKAWKVEEHWQLKRHKAATVKSLYGKTASYVYYDRAKKRGCADVIQNPRNLWLGYKDDDYESLEWAAHVTLMDPMAVVEKYSVDLRAMPDIDGQTIVPWVSTVGEVIANMPHPDLTFGPSRIEVWDYWYRKPGKRGKRGEPTKMDTWNVVIAGNAVVRGPVKYTEYEGEMPYLPLFNSFIPGTPLGRSDLHDMEQLIRETMTRITAGAQMIAKATAGDYWQVTGENAPARGRSDVKPVLNQAVSAGPGNRFEAIQPFVIQFQLEQYLGRLDREKATLSGLNDLLLGLAPSGVLNSSKAINALTANYETRMAMSRLLFYQWDKNTWDLVVQVWQKFDDTIQQVVDAGGGTLDIQNPSLSPRDEFETAQRAGNLVAAKLWSQARGMEATGVEDPEQEQNIIREESTDATLWPDRVTVMAQLMSTLQSMGLQAPAGAEQQAGGQVGSGQEALRQALGAGTGQNTEGSQYGTQGETPPIEGAPPEAGGAQPPFAAGQPGAGASTQLQSMIQGGTQKTRIMTNRKIGRP